MIAAFLYGIVLAFSLIIPLGIQNIFLFNQGATQKHFLHALPSILTASVCDTILILLAVLGTSVIVLTVPWLKSSIFLLGFVFLVYMGWSTWKTAATRLPHASTPLSAKRQITFAASVSVLNPHAWLDSVSVIGTNSLNFDGYARWSYTAACILVSCAWFFGIAMAGHFFIKADKTGLGMRLINKVSALIIWGVAVYLAMQLYQDFLILQ